MRDIFSQPAAASEKRRVSKPGSTGGAASSRARIARDRHIRSPHISGVLSRRRAGSPGEDQASEQDHKGNRNSIFLIYSSKLILFIFIINWTLSDCDQTGEVH